MKVAVVRGKYLNRFEMQNYASLTGQFDVVGFASLFPIHSDVGFSVKKLASPMDLPDFPFKLAFLNRAMVDAMYLFGLERKLQGFDLTCVRETYFHFTQQALNAKQKGLVKKVIVTCSETIPFNHQGIWGRKKFKQRTITLADHFHCLTKRAKDCLVKEGADPGKISVVGYGIDLDRFKPRQKKVIRRNELNLLFVGRLEEQKGIKELLKAYRKIKRDYPKVSLRIVGKGPFRSVIEKQGIKTETFPYSKMPAIYHQADIFVLPSKPTNNWEEYYGMALLEAMASGLPVVTTDCGAIPEVVGGAALISPHSQAEKLYSSLKLMISNAKKREIYGRKAYQHAKKSFDCQKQADKIGLLWRKLLD